MYNVVTTMNLNNFQGEQLEKYFEKMLQFLSFQPEK